MTEGRSHQLSAPSHYESSPDIEWLETKLRPWKDSIFPDLVLGHSSDLDRVALIHDQQIWTYTQLIDAVDGAAKCLVGRYGVRPGDRVAMKMENSDLFVIVYLAIHLAGATAVPLNTKLTQSEIDYQIQDSSPRIAIAPVSLSAAVRHVRPESLLEAPNGEVSLPQVSPDAAATIFYTSGTTGSPKGVIHSHRTLIAGAFQNCRGWGYELRHSVTLAMTPLFHIAAHSWFYPVLANQGTLVIDSFKTERAFELISRNGVDGFGGVPAMLLMMLEMPLRHTFDLSSVRNIRFGASSMPPERILELRDLFPNAALYHGMGQTESGGTISVLGDEFALSKAGSTGLPIPGVAVQVVDDSGKVVPRGTAGEVLARGPHVMVGYLNQPEATAKTLAGDWLHTGDVGVMDDDGMITLVDRKKDMIIRGGENIYSLEVENVFLTHELVRECAVIGLQDPILQETVAAVVVTDHPITETMRETLVAYGREKLAPFKVPVRWFVAATLPRTATGKIQKQELRGAVTKGNFVEF